MRKVTVVIVPGLRDAMPDHWQSHLQAAIAGAVCVPRRTEGKLSLPLWVHALDRTLAAIRGDVILVAHSAGCHIVTHWALKHRRQIRAALLATPPDFARALPESYPQPDTLRANGWTPVPRERLPFTSLVAASTNDPLCSPEAAYAMAHDWGSRLLDLGPVGHLNPASGHGPWPMAEQLVDELIETTKKREPA